MTIDDALARFLVQLEADGRSEHTRRQYARHVGALAAWVGPGRAVEDVGHEDIAAFLAAPVARTRPDGRIKKANSVNALRGSLRGFFRYLHQAGVIAQDPTRLVRRALCGRPLPRALSDDETNRLLAAIDHPRDYVLYMLLVRTGIRIGSALALDVEDLDLERGEIVLRRAKGDRAERIYVPGAVRAELATYLAGRTSGPVFQGRAGRRLGHRHAHRRLVSWLAKAGISRAASPHSLRHSFATSLYARTGDLLLVQRALRHRCIASTMVYAQIDDAPGEGGAGGVAHARLSAERHTSAYHSAHGRHRRPHFMNLRARVRDLLNPDHHADPLSRLTNAFIAGLIVANVIALVLESLPDVKSSFFRVFDGVSVLIFTVEYVGRLWSWEPKNGRGNYVPNRIRFVFTPLALIDLLAILPWYLPLMTMDLRVLRALRLLRLLRIFRLGQYSRSLRVIGQVFARTRSELAVTLTVGCILVLIASTLMYHLEHEAQPEVFSSIPAAAWWAVSTLTTVGYGDIYPVTPMGRVIGSVVATLGIGLFALPTAILGTAFLDQLRKKVPTNCPHCGGSINSPAA